MMFKEIVPAMVCLVVVFLHDTATEVDFIHDMYAAVNLHPTCDKYILILDIHTDTTHMHIYFPGSTPKLRFFLMLQKKNWD